MESNRFEHLFGMLKDTRFEDCQDAYSWIADLLNMGTIHHELATKSDSLYRKYSSS